MNPFQRSSLSLIRRVRKGIDVPEWRMTRLEVCFHYLAEGVARRHLLVCQEVASGDAVPDELDQGRHGFFWHVSERALAEHDRGQGKVKREG